MAMMHAWLDKKPLFAKHLEIAQQLVERMDNNPEVEVPMVGTPLYIYRYVQLALNQVCSVAYV